MNEREDIMARTTKLTISLPEELAVFADELARKNEVSRSQVITACIREIADKYHAASMAEGYAALAKEQRRMAARAARMTAEPAAAQ